MAITIGIVGAGQFSGHFARLWQLHPGVGDVFVTDVLPERAERLASEYELAGTHPSFEAMLDSDLDAVAIFTQRWTHGPLVVQALRAGKHVYSAVPMAVTREEIAEIMGLTTKAVKSLLSRARDNLRDVLRAYIDMDHGPAAEEPDAPQR